jgi:hypothetical protein
VDETDTAMALTPSLLRTIVLGLASEELDAAQPVTIAAAGSTIAVGLAAEADSAQAVGGGADGLATEVIRWTFTDTETDEVASLILNPNKMSTPTFAREVQYAWTPAVGMAGIDRSQATPTSWTFEGVILTQGHYNRLLEWAQRGVVLRVDDHLGRAFGIIIEKYDPIERLPTANRPWRADYTMTCLLLEVLPT